MIADHITTHKGDEGKGNARGTQLTGMNIMIPHGSETKHNDHGTPDLFKNKRRNIMGRRHGNVSLMT